MTKWLAQTISSSVCVMAMLGGASVQAQPVPSAALQQLAQRAATQGKVKVIVHLNVSALVEGSLSGAAVVSQRQSINLAQDNVVNTLLAGSQSTVKARYETVPMMALEVDANALARLSASPSVQAIHEDELSAPIMAQSNPQINAPTAWARGYTGTNWAVAVLDTGVEKTHEFLAGKVVSEACYSTTSVANNSTSACPGGVSNSTAVGSGVPCVGSGDCPHGTHVAGTAAGGTRPADNSHGVAYGANVLAMQVFSYFPNYAGGGVTRMLSFSSDQISALERVYALRNTYNIASVNMSLGGSPSATTCDTNPLKPVIDNLRSVGIATVIAAGNNGVTAGISAPGCISTAISVGAVCDASSSSTCALGIDGVASYSNIASFISLLAPGSFIISSVPGGNTYASYNGTSMAAPHVAGAWAVLKQSNPGISVTDGLAAFRANGVAVNDGRVGGTVTNMKRINMAFINGFDLTVSKAGTAAANGSVASAPAGIACGATCTKNFPVGTAVTLTASAPSGTTFAGWGGSCTGTVNTCVVTMSAARNVTATFNAVTASTIAFSSATRSVGEGTASLSITVTRSSGVGTASVSYATANGTATAGADYVARSGVLNFAAGVTSRTFTITILEDTLVEGNETFTLALSSPVGASLGSPSVTTATIVDNDSGNATPTVQLGAATHSVNENAGTATITVTRSSGTGVASVQYATSSGTATAGADFTHTSGTLNFAAGQVSTSFTVPVTNDTTVEGNETFNVTLSNPVGASLGTPSAAVVTIVDDDVAPGGTVQFHSATYSVNEGTTVVSITVTRSSAVGTASVSYTTVNGSAVAGADYVARSGTLSFAAGVTSRTFNVTMVNDTVAEPSQVFTIALSGAVGATLGAVSTATVTIIDND